MQCLGYFPGIPGVLGFQKKIHFLLGNLPHFIEHHMEVNHVGKLGDLKQTGDPVQKRDIPRHGFPDSGTLDFDRYPLAAF